MTIRDEYLFRSKVPQASYENRDNTILHELAHMWFGDLVTMRWWDDLWLNESFAEWCSHYAQSQIAAHWGGIDPWTGFANNRKLWAYRQDQLPTTHPIAADMVDLEAVEQNFDGITYAKGASVLKQLVAYVGQDAFLAGVRDYLAEHAFDNAELSDLLAALEKTSGRDLSGFAGQWLQTCGVNTIRADYDLDQDSRFTRFELVQTAPQQYPTLRTHRLAVGCYDLTDFDFMCSDLIELDVTGSRTAVPELIGRKHPDLLLPNDRDLSFVKVRLDEISLRNITHQMDALADPLARAVVWGAAQDMCRDAELSAADYTDMVLGGIGNEQDPTAIVLQLAQARMVSTAYTAHDQRLAARAHLVAGLAKMLKDADPGSDVQLAAADNLIGAVDSAAGIVVLKSWLNGEEVPYGLPIDADRRWLIVTNLARLGVIGTAEIDAEVEADQTIKGAESAAGARSALADAAAKQTAWRIATQDPDVPNGTHLAICQRFWQYGQEELLADYPTRYLELCEQISANQGIWATSGNAASQAALRWLFPAPLADQGFIDHLDQWAEQAKISDPIRRVLSELRAEALRALAAQRFGAQTPEPAADNAPAVNKSSSNADSAGTNSMIPTSDRA